MAYKTNIDQFLTSISKVLNVPRTTTAQVDAKILDVRKKFSQHTSANVLSVVPFGAYTRGTLLPLDYDRRASVGLLVQFSDTGLHPQTYLDRIEHLLCASYPSRSHLRDATSITLPAHPYPLRLVPALDAGHAGFRIPAQNMVSGWRHANPAEFSRRLDFADQFNQKLIRPLIRVIKYWNGVNAYPFHPFHLEYEIVNKGYQYLGGSLSAPRLFNYIHDFLSNCGLHDLTTPRKHKLLKRTRVLLDRCHRLDEGGRRDAAMKCVAEILPALEPEMPTMMRRRWLVI